MNNRSHNLTPKAQAEALSLAEHSAQQLSQLKADSSLLLQQLMQEQQFKLQQMMIQLQQKPQEASDEQNKPAV
ncbi:hypothetical protein ACFO3I_14305 [Rheinheimera marina]|uniref:Uncharacterized protein n=1 Tax=Rheinheimera marina TaxID=1774958 RepID=A0ABV9JPJ5_9GAMM